ncbi:MAG: RES family NAD+ phosphorylase [Terracidiphilus sp.]
MTPEDQSLDPHYFLDHQPLTLFRLTKTKYANLSGVGAALVPGRWNNSGQEAIYTSTEVGTCGLEMLAHTSKALIPSNLALMKIRVSGQWEPHKDVLFDAKTSGSLRIYRSIAETRDDYQESQHWFPGDDNPFAVAVPSVIVPAWNVVLFPQGKGFWEHVSLESVEPFQFDPRLFPDDALAEPKE